MADDVQHAADTGPGAGWQPQLKHALAMVFLGDWDPPLRDPLDLLRLSFGVGALVFAVLGDWDAFVRLLIPGLLVLLIRALDVPRPVDWLFCLAMCCQLLSLPSTERRPRAAS